MSEKQIDLDAMRALADEVLNTPTHIRVNNPRELAANLYFATDEIEHLRKERDALREALREVSETRIFVSSKDAANRAIDIADAALAAQGAKPNA